MHPQIIFAKFQTHANVIPRRYPDVETREPETNEHGEYVVRWGVIPMQFPFIIYGMELYINDSIYRQTL